ncbi:hypothetical protein ACIBCM_12420 [Streptomyces sp. NPDC051018]|uniref:hypothetical protein n=1 Tax=Streptomyces sp. NPDC051018 TaxID=3365639 RepID=UPI0037996801
MPEPEHEQYETEHSGTREASESRETNGTRDTNGPPDTGETLERSGTESESDGERRRRRAQFLRELNEAKALRERVQPRRARAARMRQQMRMRTFRW